MASPSSMRSNVAYRSSLKSPSRRTSRPLIESVSMLARRVPNREQPFDGADVADASLASVVFESGAIGTFASTHLLRWPHRIGLHLVSDGMVIELSEFELMVDVGHGRPITPARRDPFVAELRD